METNVGGTENMLDAAKRSGAKFYHMSTCSVSGDELKDSRTDVMFTENDFDIGQNWTSNIYIKSKFLAEKAVFEAMENGVDAKIFRLGRLVGRASDGKFQQNPETNAFYLLMKGFSMLGAIPAQVENQRIDLMPIDTSVKEVLALRNSNNKVFHIMNPAPPTVKEVMSALNKNIKTVNNIELYNILQDKTADIDDALRGVVIDYIFKASKDSKIHVTNAITTESLAESGYCCEAMDLETVLCEFWKGKQ